MAIGATQVRQNGLGGLAVALPDVVNPPQSTWGATPAVTRPAQPVTAVLGPPAHSSHRPLPYVEHSRQTGARQVLKTVWETPAAAFLLLLLAPVMGVLGVLVKLDSRGPAFYRQTRVGRDGREFRMIKLRTMVADADQQAHLLRNDSDGVLFKMRSDPRITRIGRILRHYSLDELPQIINVLLGHMSLIGPRPALPAEVARYPHDMRRRFAVKPGMTGLWQVSGRSDLSWADSVRLDLSYVDNWSISMDLVILLRTVVVVFRGTGAY